MAIKIGHASIDENNSIINGKIGDQTGKEICTRLWYSKPWNVYLECTDDKIADKAATYMEQICADDNYGYDQNERLTGYNSIVKNANKVKGGNGEFDCSSLVSSCYKFAGLNVSPSNTTSSIRNSFLATGLFKAYTDSNHITNDSYAKRGGIYLSEGHHVVMALEDGSMIKKTVINSSGWVAKLQKEIGAKVDNDAGAETLSKTPTIKRGDKGTVVKLLQEKLLSLGYDPKGVDGSYGNEPYHGLYDAIIKYQKEVVKLSKPDGEFTAKGLSWQTILGLR